MSPTKKGFFVYPPEMVYPRHDPVVTDGAEGVSPRVAHCGTDLDLIGIIPALG